MQFAPAREIDFRSLKLLMERSTGGSALKKRREIERITKAYRRGALVIPPNETEQQKWWRCEARFMLGDYSDWQGWEYRDEWSATLWHLKPYPVPPWNGLPTDCLYVIGEQGVGDEICFASCLPDCQRLAKRVILECEPRLCSIFERSLGVETAPARIVGTKRMKQDLPAGVTAWMALADLPRMWRLNLGHFPQKPYIVADSQQVERFAAYKGRTGISWRGAQGEVKDIIAMHPDALSLQYDMDWQEDVETPAGLDLRGDLEGLLGLLANLDKVVTVSTSVAHFAAALGVETHVVIADPTTGVRGNLFPFKWICQKTPGRTPWYGAARTYESIHAYRAAIRQK